MISSIIFTVRCREQLKFVNVAHKISCSFINIIFFNSDQHLYGIRPLDPADPPLLIPERKPGLFSISVMDAVPQFGSGEMDNGTMNVHPVTFLFKFEVVNSSDVFYDWSVSQ